MFFYFRLTIEFGQFVSVIRCSVTLQVVVVLCFVPTVAVCFFRFIGELVLIRPNEVLELHLSPPL